uniref:Uncharacterized protein n=1 Tax=Arundo donax TaxID=35708 RepID=A0A0A9FAB2_ARUDO
MRICCFIHAFPFHVCCYNLVVRHCDAWHTLPRFKNPLLCIWSVKMVCMLAMLCKLYLWSSCSDGIVASHLASSVMYYCPQRVTLQPVIVISNCPLYGTE